MKNRDRGGPRPQPAPNQPFLIRPGLIGTRIHDLGIRTLAGRIFLLATTYRCHCRAVFQPHLPVGVVPTTVNSPTTAELALFVGCNSISKNLRIPKSLHRQRGRCYYAYCRGQRLLHQIFYPRPQVGVALALGVSRSDEAVIPR